ncbi:MAG: hypothetical protein PHS86_15400 [Syntrophaceae bacterium]|nr:hypothetical protein [Syntrophaceae bacterium]
MKKTYREHSRDHCPSDERSNNVGLFHGRRSIFKPWLVYGVAIMFAPVMLLSGCGVKEELEKAQRVVAETTSKNNELSNQVANLTEEKNNLSEEVTKNRREIENLRNEVARLDKIKNTLEQESRKLNNDLETSNRKNVQLTNQIKSAEKEIDDLKKRLTDFEKIKSHQTPAPETLKSVNGKSEERSHCDYLVEFMQKSQQAIRSSKGRDRNKMLNDIKSEYAPKFKGAPVAAIKSAESWVKEMSRSWDRHGEDTVYLLIKYRNSVLKACGMDPDKKGF